MKQINFIISVLAMLISFGMVYGAAVTESHMKAFSVTVFTVISALCVGLVVMSWRELKDV